jgi:hypothetical protein
MTALRARLGREEGVAMVLVVILAAFLTLTSITLIDIVRAESNRSAHSVWSEGSFQAAEAGLDDYVAKMVDDRVYYLHQVHAAESTRRPSSGPDVAAGGTWAGGITWTYPNGKDAWKQLTNGYEYNVQVIPPSAGSTSTRILATGRKVGSTTDVRVIESLVRPSLLSDFYRLSDDDVSWGSGASTYGKIYVNGNVNHQGTAYADIYAEGSINGNPSMQNGAKKYDSTTIRTKIKNPINFANFLVSFVDIKRAAQSGGLYLAGSATTIWRLTFNSNGTVTVQTCVPSGTNDPSLVAPVCSAYAGSPFPVPSNGAIYTERTAVVSGQVSGRVTVGSNDDIVVASNLGPVTAGTDVIGLAALNDFWVASWAPYNLDWTAAVLVQNNTWNAAGANGSHGTMNFWGSSATKTGGGFSAFDTRNYNYDQTLLYLPPPWFPVIDDTYTVSLFRELPGG